MDLLLVGVSKLLFLVVISSAVKFRNNVCRTYDDYNHMQTSDNCWYNPDVTSDVPEIIIRHGYPLETHRVTTKDNYILTMFRIPPRNNSKGVVLLEHPLSTTSIVWVDKGEDSLGFDLAKAGYDVWMANARGTKHSKRHVFLSPKQRAYWNFSFHEIGLHDLQAQFELVKNITGRGDIAFIAHSMGCTSALIYASLRPEEAKSFAKVFITMAPPAYFHHVQTPFKDFAPLGPVILDFLNSIGLYEFSNNRNIRRIFEAICLASSSQLKFCSSLLTLIMGPHQLNPLWIPIAGSHSPTGIPLKCCSHYIQQVLADGRFQYYDYGPILNRYYYNSDIPPEYPIKNITVPFYIMYGKDDYLAAPKDVLMLYDQLQPSAKIYGIHSFNYSHVDFTYGKSVKKIAYDHIVKFLDTIIYIYK